MSMCAGRSPAGISIDREVREDSRMTTNREDRLEQQPSLIAGKPGAKSASGRDAHGAFAIADGGSPEGRYLSGVGKPLAQQISDLRDRMVGALARADELRAAVQQAERTDEEQEKHHRGGDRPWPLRLLIPVGTLAESLTAYVAVEVLVTGQALAIALAMLAALVATGMACVFANRRLSNLAVLGVARFIEAMFVAVLTVLRYESLRVQGAGLLSAGGAAALAGLISALVLLGMEEVVVETRTLSLFVSTQRVAWRRWRLAYAVSRLSRIRARVEAAAEKLQQHFLEFLLRAEGFSLDAARKCAATLRRAVIEGDGSR
jgi:hypothetical protein